jgi:hypothetical protein
MTTTFSAPPSRRSTRAHSLVVAPVVKTSSTSRMRRPWRSILGCQRRGCLNEKAPRRFRSRSSRSRFACASVARVRTSAFAAGMPVKLCQPLAQLPALIELSVTLAAAMQRHRHQQPVREIFPRQPGLLQHPQQQRGQRPAQLQPTVILELMNQLPHRLLRTAGRHGELKLQFPPAAVHAAELIRERAVIHLTAHLAVRRLHQRQRFLTATAEPRLRTQNVVPPAAVERGRSCTNAGKTDPPQPSSPAATAVADEIRQVDRERTSRRIIAI